MLCVFNFVQRFFQSSKALGLLSPFQKFLLCGKDLAYMFGAISESTVSRTFLHGIDVLYHRFKPLINWPKKKTLPMDFHKHCPSCVAIIDCFKILMDRPLNPLFRAQTFSNYKHHNTVKFLIGISPQGTVTFISEGWGASGISYSWRCLSSRQRI